jgi:uncharacterized membrane protein
MSHLAAYAVTVVVFLVVDAIWLKLVIRPLFERFVGHMLLDDPRLGVAAGFYALYCVGLLYFAAIPATEPGGGGVPAALRDGALLGAFAYGTYEATNYATLKSWNWRMVAVDVAWGTVLSAVSAAAGALVL